MLSLGLTNREREAIKREIEKPFSVYFLREHRSLDTLKLQRLDERNGSKLMEMFFEHEKVALKEAGLNQASIAVIIERTRKAQATILKHLIADASVLTGKYARALGALRTFMGIIHRSAVWEKADEREQVLVPGATLLRAKDKVIGLATLWGNAVPLILTRDWGITSVISTTAGATVACILPSGK